MENQVFILEGDSWMEMPDRMCGAFCDTITGREVCKGCTGIQGGATATE